MWEICERDLWPIKGPSLGGLSRRSQPQSPSPGLISLLLAAAECGARPSVVLARAFAFWARSSLRARSLHSSSPSSAIRAQWVCVGARGALLGPLFKKEQCGKTKESQSSFWAKRSFARARCFLALLLLLRSFLDPQLPTERGKGERRPAARVRGIGVQTVRNAVKQPTSPKCEKGK